MLVGKQCKNMLLWKYQISLGSKETTSSSQITPGIHFFSEQWQKGMFALVWDAKEAVVAADLHGDIWRWSQEKACLEAYGPWKPGHLDLSRSKLCQEPRRKE